MAHDSTGAIRKRENVEALLFDALMQEKSANLGDFSENSDIMGAPFSGSVKVFVEA